VNPKAHGGMPDPKPQPHSQSQPVAKLKPIDMFAPPKEEEEQG